jgi:hypothetical protein
LQVSNLFKNPVSVGPQAGTQMNPL